MDNLRRDIFYAFEEKDEELYSKNKSEDKVLSRFVNVPKIYGQKRKPANHSPQSPNHPDSNKVNVH